MIRFKIEKSSAAWGDREFAPRRYTSGTTGSPKGIVRDNTHAVALQWSMDHFMGLAPGETSQESPRRTERKRERERERERCAYARGYVCHARRAHMCRYWAAADIGWVVGHSYICYAPLLQGCTTVVYEGKPVGTPDAAEYWRVVERYGVHALFTAPTVLRALRQADPMTALAKRYDLSTLRTLFV